MQDGAAVRVATGLIGDYLHQQGQGKPPPPEAEVVAAFDAEINGWKERMRSAHNTNGLVHGLFVPVLVTVGLGFCYAINRARLTSWADAGKRVLDGALTAVPIVAMYTALEIQNDITVKSYQGEIERLNDSKQRFLSFLAAAPPTSPDAVAALTVDADPAALAREVKSRTMDLALRLVTVTGTTVFSKRKTHDDAAAAIVQPIADYVNGGATTSLNDTLNNSNDALFQAMDAVVLYAYPLVLGISDSDQQFPAPEIRAYMPQYARRQYPLLHDAFTSTDTGRPLVSSGPQDAKAAVQNVVRWFIDRGAGASAVKQLYDTLPTQHALTVVNQEALQRYLLDERWAATAHATAGPSLLPSAYQQVAAEVVATAFVALTPGDLETRRDRRFVERLAAASVDRQSALTSDAAGAFEDLQERLAAAVASEDVKDKASALLWQVRNAARATPHARTVTGELVPGEPGMKAGARFSDLARFREAIKPYDSKTQLREALFGKAPGLFPRVHAFCRKATSAVQLNKPDAVLNPVFVEINAKKIGDAVTGLAVAFIVGLAIRIAWGVGWEQWNVTGVVVPLLGALLLSSIVSAAQVRAKAVCAARVRSLCDQTEKVRAAMQSVDELLGQLDEDPAAWSEQRLHRLHGSLMSLVEAYFEKDSLLTAFAAGNQRFPWDKTVLSVLAISVLVATIVVVLQVLPPMSKLHEIREMLHSTSSNVVRFDVSKSPYAGYVALGLGGLAVIVASALILHGATSHVG
jgi:hypothetical protein